jgi:hypothetical protein
MSHTTVNCPLNVVIVTLNVARFSLTVKYRNTTVKCRNIHSHVKKLVLCQYLSYVSELGISFLSDRERFAVMSKILVEIKVIFVGIINWWPLFMPKGPLVIKRICTFFFHLASQMSWVQARGLSPKDSIWYKYFFVGFYIASTQ